jgi:hypothetical protein
VLCAPSLTIVNSRYVLKYKYNNDDGDIRKCLGCLPDNKENKKKRMRGR